MNKNTLLAFLGGIVAGGFTALLLAPKSGEETRDLIGDKIKSGVKSSLGEDQYEDLCNKIQELKNTVAEKIKKTNSLKDEIIEEIEENLQS